MHAVNAPQRYIRNAHHFGYGTCPLCLEPGKRLITDHCHAHGWIRGQICESCNQSLWHGERRWSMPDLLRGVCWHRHRSDETRERCWAAFRKANARRIEHFRRCPDCSALVAERWPA